MDENFNPLHLAWIIPLCLGGLYFLFLDLPFGKKYRPIWYQKARDKQRERKEKADEEREKFLAGLSPEERKRERLKGFKLIEGKCPRCYKEVSRLATKCPHCTAEI